MKEYEFKDADYEDIDDILVRIESSFDIKFAVGELTYVTTFGQLCDHVTGKIQLENTNDCTTQQAFYKLRDAIEATVQIDRNSISTDLPLAAIFPRKNRRAQLVKLEEHLGFRLNILRPAHWLTVTLLMLLLASFIGLFFSLQIGFSGLVFSFTGLWLIYKIGKQFDVQTVGQVAEKMTRENYLRSRRNPKTFNKQEIEKVLTDWFCNELGLDKSNLTRETKFG